MNLRNWNREHTKGLIVGLLTICVAIFVVLWFFSFKNGQSYLFNLHQFIHFNEYTAKVISMAAIANLPWFHFASLRTKNWAFGQGIIVATIVDLLVMIVFKFIL